MMFLSLFAIEMQWGALNFGFSGCHDRHLCHHSSGNALIFYSKPIVLQKEGLLQALVTILAIYSYTKPASSDLK